MIDRLVEQSYYYLMNEDYLRIKNGKKMTILNLPYTFNYLNDLIVYFESKEEYEKCIPIVNLKNIMMDHEKNYNIQPQ